MRLWSIHPKYLDNKGLVALWRESLLAKKVLMGNTKGYKNHPQLKRFKNEKDSLREIDAYLCFVLEEALKRGFNFDKSKVCKVKRYDLIPVTSNQIDSEFNLLKKKLKKRSPKKYNELKAIRKVFTHPLFKRVRGQIFHCLEDK